MGISGQLQASAALPQGKHPLYQMTRRPNEPQIWSVRCEDEKKSLASVGNRTTISPLMYSQQSGHYTNYAMPAYVTSL
jgi:hypothetical protein